MSTAHARAGMTHVRLLASGAGNLGAGKIQLYSVTASALALAFPGRYSICRFSSYSAIPHLASFQEGCGVLRSDLSAS